HHPDDYVHRIGRTGRAGRSGTAITIVAPADRKSVAAIEKLIGQTIPWMGEELQPSAHEHTERGHTEARDHRKGERHKGKPRKDEPHKKRDPRARGPRGQERVPSARRDNAPASVPRLDEMRPRRAPKAAPRPAHADDGGHLPAFLLRPFRVKA